MPTTTPWPRPTVGSFKTEQIHRQGLWRDAGRVEVATLERVDFFNTIRTHEFLDDLTPAVADALLYDQRKILAPTELDTKPSLRNPQEVRSTSSLPANDRADGLWAVLTRRRGTLARANRFGWDRRRAPTALPQLFDLWHRPPVPGN